MYYGRAKASKHRWFSGRMLACHAGGPGSIPGRCRIVFFVLFKGHNTSENFTQNLWHPFLLQIRWNFFQITIMLCCQARTNYPVLLVEFTNLFFSSRTFLFSLLSWSTSRELYELQRRADSVDGFSHEAGVAGLVKGVGVVVQLCAKKIEVACTTFKNPTVLPEMFHME